VKKFMQDNPPLAEEIETTLRKKLGLIAEEEPKPSTKPEAQKKTAKS
jgi:hypothetical protein